MYASFNRFELKMTLAQALDACHQGPCDDDVDALVKTPKLRKQLAQISDMALAAELKEWGAWSENELQDRDFNERRIVWLAAGQIVDNNR